MGLGLLIAVAACGTIGAGDAREPSRERLLVRMLGQPRSAGTHAAGPSGGAIPECLRAPGEGAPGWGDHHARAWSVFDPVEDPIRSSACFDPSSPPSWEIQRAVNELMHGALADRFVLNSRWPGSNNAPISLTWSFVPDGTSIPGSATVGEPTSNSTLFQTMASRFGEANRAVWMAQFQACFDRWSALTGVTYTFVRNNGNDWDDGAPFPNSAGSNTPGATRGDIRIACHPIDGGGGVLAYNYYPSGGDMVLDSAETWNFGAPNYRYLRNTVMHEHGHGLGLAHVCPTNQTKLMEPFIVTAYDGPQHDDIRGVQYRYGDRYEPNNTRLTAAPIGALAAGQSLTPSAVPSPAVSEGSLTGLSLDGDEDWYLFTAPAPLIGTITLTPAGQNYADYVQDAQCGNTTPNINSRSIADLRLEFYNSSGTLLATADAAGFGGTETLSGVLFSPPGNLYVRVRENNVPTETQLYSLTIAAAEAPGFEASDGAFSNRVRVAWTPIRGATGYTLYRSTINNRSLASVINSPGASATSFEDFSVVFGTTYHYWLEVNTGLGGPRPVGGPETGFISSANAPANDFCANAPAAVKDSVVSGTLTGATNDGTATCGSSSTNADVWYVFTAACDGTLRLSTCGTNDTGGVDLGIDPVLSVWSACPASGGVQLACNDNAFNLECEGLDAGAPRDAALSRPMTSGQSLRIRVSKAASGAVGPFTLRVGFSVPGDACAEPVVIAPGQAVPFCSTMASTDGAPEPSCFASSGAQADNDLWFAYTPPTGGRFAVRTCGSGFDTRLAVYSACGGVVLACNDNAEACGPGSLQSALTAVGSAGVACLIRVGGVGTLGGNGQLRVYCAADFNRSGDTTLQDLFDYLTAYLSADPDAEFNGDGAQSVQDIFDYLTSWFGGC
ncbi:MAG: matrixin family metalloprotease [Phycisphaerales bacterium]